MAIVRIVIEECVSRYDVRGETETGYALDIREVYVTKGRMKSEAHALARQVAQEMAGKYGLAEYEFLSLPKKQEMK